MICNNCGSEVENGTAFCGKCGAALNGAENQTAYQNQNAGYQQGNMNQNMGMPTNYGAPVYMAPVGIPNYDPSMDYTPISMWGYFGYEILFSIPLVGLIMLLVFSFGGTRRICLRNFARSYFCYLIVVAVIAGLVVLAIS